MAVTTPQWLTQRGGRLLQQPDKRSWAVLFDGSPQYRVTPIPAAGKYGCEVLQTVNGRRLERARTYPSLEEAIAGGLEDLRQALGWA